MPSERLDLTVLWTVLSAVKRACFQTWDNPFLAAGNSSFEEVPEECIYF